MSLQEEFVQALKPKRGYWYYSVQNQCVICGRGGTDKIRRHDKKPKNSDKRREVKEYVCDHH